ncbi:MAG: hypothetical protein J0L62_01750 [Bacteroidetes bacterium]|nr:hypothetical protein [Bacteroidota bacterium]
MNTINTIVWTLLLFLTVWLTSEESEPIEKAIEISHSDSTQIVLPIAVIICGNRVSEQGFLVLLTKNQELRNQFFRNSRKN